MRRVLSKALTAGLVWSSASPALASRCEPIRAMSYNIRQDVETDGDNRWAMRRTAFVGQIDWMQPDILGLQEVVPGQKRDLEQDLPGYVFVGTGREGLDRGEHALLAIARDRFRIRNSGTFWLSETPAAPSKGWDAALPRIATWARLVRKRDGKRLFVVNTHLDHVGQLAKLQGARQIAAFIATSRRSAEAVIMTGDLNALPDSPVLAALLGAPLSLRDSRTHSATPPSGPSATFNAFKLLPPGEKRIDYVLHDGSLKSLRHATLAWPGENGRLASDHFAVVADLVDGQCPA